MISSYFKIDISSVSDMVWFLVTCLMVVSLLVQLSYFFFQYRKLIIYKKKDVKSATEPVSVIICARNEAENLEKFLPTVLNQFYPDFEVIVVNDGSTDNTSDVLAALKQKYPQLYITTIEPRADSRSGKKLAQTIGIKAAHHDQLLFIDADCEPASPNWIRHMQSNFLKQTEIILGYGPYFPEPGLLNKWIRTDTVYIAMQYLSSTLKGQSYMGVGRNLAYRRNLFFRNKGHASHLHIPSGDDDLFINETSNIYNTTVEIHHDSFTYSIPNKRWKDWIRQKRRHLGAGKAYKKSNKKRIAVEIVSRELFFLSAIALLITGYAAIYAAISLFIRITIFGVFFKLVTNRLKERNLLLISYVYDFFWPLIGAFLMITTTVKKKPSKWK